MIALPLVLSVFNVDLVADLSATVSMIGAAVLMELENYEDAPRRPACGGACDASTINGLDRWVTENDNASARFASDLGLDAMLLVPVLGAVEDPKDVVVGYETLAATMLATQVLKFAIHRPRPLAYNEAFPLEERTDGDAQLSFPSGHSSMSFASATAFAVPWVERHDGALAFAGAAAAYVVATTVAVLRVIGGKHFVTDVLAGAVLGISVGLAVTFAHRQDMDVR